MISIYLAVVFVQYVLFNTHLLPPVPHLNVNSMTGLNTAKTLSVYQKVDKSLAFDEN